MSSEQPPPSAWRQQQPDWSEPEPAAPVEPDAAAPPGYFRPATKSQPRRGTPGMLEEPGTSWRRALALVIDVLVLAFADAIVTAPFPEPVSLSGIAWGWLVIHLALGLVLSALYSGWLEGSDRGQSVGKMARGLQVRDADMGGPIGFQRAAIRRLVADALALPVITGIANFVAMVLDDRKRAWHDKVATTVVVRVS